MLSGRTLPVLKGSLKGIKLEINDLIKGFVLLKDYEPDKQMAFNFFLKPNNIFFDVGANVGLHSYFVQKHWPNVSIYAFEPFPDNAAYIRKTISENNFNNIKLTEAAVSSEVGETFFDTGTDNSTGKITDTESGIKVKLITLDDFTQDNNIFPDLLKIDVEGAEGQVLDGSVNLIENHKPCWIIELHSPKQDLYVASFLTERGYVLYRLNEAAKTPDDQLFLIIKNLKSPWPDPDGVFGSIVAIHKDRVGEFPEFEF